MRRAATVLLVIPLCGYMAEQKKTFATCRFSLARDFGDEQTWLAGYMETCMKARGFRLQISEHCPDDAISESKLLCYQPKTWLGQIGRKIEMALRSNKGL
jgi:hypothetical protein